MEHAGALYDLALMLTREALVSIVNRCALWILIFSPSATLGIEEN